MPITATLLADGTISVEQTLTKPTIYLDHWAIREFSDDIGLQDRFIASLHASRGCLLFTVQNIVEFSPMTDVDSASRTERLLDRALPHLYVVDSSLQAGFLLPAAAYTDELLPWHDWLLKAFGQRWFTHGERLTAEGMLQEIVQHGRGLEEEFRRTNQAIAQALLAQRADPARMKKARAFRPLAGSSLRNTVMSEIVRDTHLNSKASFSPNDASDMVHAVPAAVMCDLAMLDRKWCDKIEKVRQRFKSHGITNTIARVYSHRRDGLEEFLLALESYATASRRSADNH